MTPDQIKAIFLANGFKEKDQGDGRMDLNPYAYDAARALLTAQLAEMGWFPCSPALLESGVDCAKAPRVFGGQGTSHYHQAVAGQRQAEPVAWQLAVEGYKSVLIENYQRALSEQEHFQGRGRSVAILPLYARPAPAENRYEPVARYCIDQTGCEEQDPQGPWVRFEDLPDHSDPGEVERLRKTLLETENRLEANRQYNTNRHVELGMESMQVIGERDTLRAQLAEAREDRNKLGDRYDAVESKLAERDALLRSLDDAWNSHDGKERFGALMFEVEAVVSASAEPSGPVEIALCRILDNGEFGVDPKCAMCAGTGIVKADLFKERDGKPCDGIPF